MSASPRALAHPSHPEVGARVSQRFHLARRQLRETRATPQHYFSGPADGRLLQSLWRSPGIGLAVPRALLRLGLRAAGDGGPPLAHGVSHRRQIPVRGGQVLEHLRGPGERVARVDELLARGGLGRAVQAHHRLLLARASIWPRLEHPRVLDGLCAIVRHVVDLLEASEMIPSDAASPARRRALEEMPPRACDALRPAIRVCDALRPATWGCEALRDGR